MSEKENKRKESDRRNKNEDRRKGTDPETAELFEKFEFREERKGPRRSGRDRRDDP